MIRPAFLAGLAGFGVLLTPVVIRAGSDLRHRPLPPPEVAYRDPAYLPPPPILVPAPRSMNLPLYNEPPPRLWRNP